MKAKPAPIVGSMWRNHVTREIWVVVSVDVTLGYVELRREGRRDRKSVV